jgi:hypothetical protein
MNLNVSSTEARRKTVSQEEAMTYFKPTNPVYSGFRAVGLKWSGTCAAVANRDARMTGTSVSHMPVIRGWSLVSHLPR